MECFKKLSTDSSTQLIGKSCTSALLVAGVINALHFFERKHELKLATVQQLQFAESNTGEIFEKIGLRKDFYDFIIPFIVSHTWPCYVSRLYCSKEKLRLYFGKYEPTLSFSFQNFIFSIMESRFK